MPARILSIPPGLPFLPTLAHRLLDGRIVPGFSARSDPLALADVTIFVPTRRAALSLTAAFAHAIGGDSAILPRVRPLGEPGEEAGFGMGAAGLLPVIDPLRRRLDLARLVRFWKTQVESGTASLLLAEEIALPASSADALRLAEDLARLIDEAGDEEISLEALSGLGIEDRLAEWWQLTLTFLSILTVEWPRHLSGLGLAEPAEARKAFAREEAARYRREGSRGPVIVAGSTATAPATLELMRAVGELENGAVVLPGLDTDLDDPSFSRIDRSLSLTAAGHPQYGLTRALAGLGVRREEVEALAPPPMLAARQALLSDALRPAETTERWASGSGHPDDALDGLALVEAADEGAEALAIAVAMRDALSDPKARVALTTPDRKLARRVVAELARFGIAANDSAGRSLAGTPPGTLARLALDAALRPGDPVSLVSLLKHPLTRLGLPAAEARRGARTIELIALRGGTGRADATGLADLYASRRQQSEVEGARVPRAVSLLGEAERELGGIVAARLRDALAPLDELRRAPPVEVPDFATALTRSLEALAADESGSPGGLYAEEAGRALASFLSGLVAAPQVGFPVEAGEWPDAFAALAADITVRPRAGLSQRAFVWGALEARLQDVEIMILGGLNEGTWPQGARSDAFLSRLMRAEILLDPPERRIGLAAHDFWMAMGSPRVVLTRALRSEGAPAIASRWLQRLLTRIGPEGGDRLRREGAPFLHHAARLDAAEGLPPQRISRPAPKPPADRRPDRYSVTEVEKLFRDPYAVYARRILRLEALEPLIRAPGAAERGTLYHRILARFAKDVGDPGADGAEAALIAIGREEFAAEALPPEIAAVWWPRFETLAVNVSRWERERGPRVKIRHVEAKGRWHGHDVGTALTGEADRIDVLADGSVEILDFKTGSSPSVAQARTLLAPQLALEAAMARLGAFEALGRVSTVSELAYVRLRERAFLEERLSQGPRAGREAVTADGLADAALTRFRALAAHFRDPANGFLSRARPFRSGDFSGDYDHLSRAREWALGEDESGDAGEAP